MTASKIIFSDNVSSDINECDFLIWYQNLSQNFENLHNSVHGYFPNYQYIMFLNHGGVKASFKVQKKLTNFSVTEHEGLIDMVSYFI